MYVIRNAAVPEALVATLSLYRPSITWTVVPGTASCEAFVMVASGADCVPGFASFPFVATYRSIGETAAEKSIQANTAVIAKYYIKLASKPSEKRQPLS